MTVEATATATTTGHVRNSTFVEKMVLNKWFWICASVFLFAYPLLKSIGRRLPNELPVITTLPYYSFFDETGRTFGSSELKGKVYLLHVMSSDCSGICDLSFKEVQRVQHRIRGVVDRAAIVSLTVKPDVDTPAVLYAKARELKANPNVWRFVSGPASEIQALVVNGLKVPTQLGKRTTTVEEVILSNHLVLVDQEGRVRGYYPIVKDGINKLMIDIGLLINRKSKS